MLRAISAIRRRLSWATAFEVIVLVNWGVWIASPYFHWGSTIVPLGADFFVATVGHNFWDHARSCGTCALWNGDIRGGAPAFVDTLGATLHPFVIVTTLFWGAVDGAKVTILLCFVLVGIGQWWLGASLGLGRPARMWGAAMAVVAGHMFGPLVGGLIPMVIANTTFTFVLAASLRLACRPPGRGRRLIAATGILFALLMLSGQGYVQIAFVLTIPVFAVLLLGQEWKGRVRDFGLASGLGVLLASPLLVPLTHFLPNLSKPFDPTFSRAQPLAFLPLNFVIDDRAFYLTEALQKKPFPEWYLNYVGWPTVVLAILGLTSLFRQSQARLATFLSLYILAILWTASAAPFRLMAEHTGGFDALRSFAIGVRTPSLVAGMAIPPILALAAIGLDRLLRRPPTNWRVRLTLGGADSARSIIFDHRIVVVIVAVLTLLHVRSVGQGWMLTTTLPAAEIDQVLAALETPDVQWVQTPYGEGMWVQAALDRGLKLAFFHRPWDWDDHPDPIPDLVASRVAEPNMTVKQQLSNGLFINAAAPGNEYAAVTYPDGSRTVCSARGEGGQINVRCEATRAGRLVIQEHEASGWTATISGHRQRLVDAGPWLAIEIPAGQSEVRFRYRPWDVPIGVGLMLVGVIVALIWCIWPDGELGRFWRREVRTEAQLPLPPTV